MRVAVVGAGVIGVCTAYFLAEAGHDVVVIERRNNVAEEASFGEPGILAAGSVAPWASPGMPSAFFSALWKSCSPVRLDSKLSPAMWRWILQWKKESELARYQINRERMHRLTTYSSDIMLQLRDRYQLDYEQTNGFLQLFRTEQDRQLAQPALDFLREHGITHTVLDADVDAIRQIEPALGGAAALAGGLYFPDGGAGNCPLFTRQMRSLAQALGVQFHFGATVRSIAQQDDGVSLHIDEQNFLADAVVLATGADSIPLLHALDIHLPAYPVRNYAATVPIRNFDAAPIAAMMDEHYKVAITRMDSRIRIAGTAELGAREGTRSTKMQAAALRTLLAVANDWFPDACNYNTANFWSGNSLMLPDGPPMIGETMRKNVFVNIGHGASGWAMAAGAGKLASALVSREETEIDATGLTPARYS